MSRGLTSVLLLLVASVTSAPPARAQDADGVAPPASVPVPVPVQASSPAKPLAAVSHMLVISADGCRPDVLLRAHTPNVRHMMEVGTFTMWARTVPQSITLPSHTSMLTGVTPERHKVLWNGKDVSLTVTEFMILEALAQRPGVVKTRNQLLDIAYSDDVYVDDRTIDSHIKRIRRKFRAADPEFDAVETLYGVGYRFDEQ